MFSGVIIIAACVVIVIFSLYGPMNLPVSTDTAVHLWIAEQILDGKQLYRDVIEVNMPSICYYFVPIVAFAEFLGISHAITAITLFVILAFTSLYLCWQIIVRSKSHTQKGVHRLFILMLSFIFFILFYYHFGQKEHLFIMMAMPYLLMVALQAQNVSRGMSVTIGILAGLGFIIKPFFVLYFVFAELTQIIHRRNFFAWVRCETLTVISLGLIYAVILLLYFPVYLLEMLPLIMDGYRHYHSIAFSSLITAVTVQFLAMAGFLFPVLLVKSWIKPNHFVIVLSGYLVISFAIVFWQAKGWDYHIYLITSMALLLYVPFLAVFFHNMHQIFITKGSTIPLGKVLDILIFLSFLVALTFLSLVALTFRDRDKKDEYIDIVTANIRQYTPDAKNLLVFGYVSDAFPLMLKIPQKWASRFIHMWLPEVINTYGLYFPGQENSMASYRDYVFDAVVEDLEEKKPEMVIIAEIPTVDYLDFFMKSEEFRSVWQDYEKVEQEKIGNTVYHFYKLSSTPEPDVTPHPAPLPLK